VNQRTSRSNTAEPEESKSTEQTERSKAMQSGVTKIDTGMPGGPRGTTKIDTSSDPSSKKTIVQERKITGVLVTFSWRPQGELFVLYEGRNVLGSAESSDIQIMTDPIMSGDHAVILCRAGRDELHDLLSTNGTFRNEKYVERDGVDLADHDSIRTGGTVFEFRKITSGAGEVMPHEQSQQGDNGSGGKRETRI
jgi:pSer/pThr/pTyr-binding forkhead associated (FHA) protein